VLRRRLPRSLEYSRNRAASRKGEPADVGAQVVGSVRRVIEQTSEVERRDVEELLAGYGLEDRLDVLDLPGQSDVPLGKSNAAYQLGSRC
jgi:hypothetical protein